MHAIKYGYAKHENTVQFKASHAFMEKSVSGIGLVVCCFCLMFFLHFRRTTYAFFFNVFFFRPSIAIQYNNTIFISGNRFKFYQALKQKLCNKSNEKCQYFQCGIEPQKKMEKMKNNIFLFVSSDD